ncbi:MAG: CRISPR-associated protein Cas2 [Candidatus Methanohalarchaeum thermophilum]|uniref:CRISPR-associated endoribonuclease Cas2 n=1 Tax=Methanohalarchaeum thermophilum TaxID=1903181 RepID=A0A1Q6DWQ7_METT1|nr:MAG: CRISPR-associated protein Cas2 [Candidatus Methanohalarchaeum thermophilum]
MSETEHLAIAYDISDDKNRRKVYKTLRKYGAWKQYSVFELEVTKTERVKLEDELQKHLETGDKIRIYSLCKKCADNIKDLGEDTSGKSSNII